MKRTRHAAVLFTKYPQPGVTKTRLMEENGGGLTAEMAADLYRAMVLDTASVTLRALDACRRRHAASADFDLYVERHNRKLERFDEVVVCRRAGRGRYCGGQQRHDHIDS